MENNNSEEFNFEKFNDMMSKIKSGSPVHKINFTLESANAISGTYLATVPDIKSYLGKMLDLDGINSDTLLVFESRHVIECCQIIYGYLYVVDVLKLSKYSSTFIIDKIINTLLKTPLFYSKMIIEMSELATSCIISSSDNGKKILETFKYIMENIWFLPYGEIDKIAKECIEEFKTQKGGENNE